MYATIHLSIQTYVEGEQQFSTHVRGEEGCRSNKYVRFSEDSTVPNPYLMNTPLLNTTL